MKGRPQVQFKLCKKRNGWARIYFALLTLFILCFTSSCAYPLAFLFNKEAMPKELGDIWVPKKKSIRSTNRIQYVEPVDPNILKGPLSLAQVVDFSLKNNPNTALSWASILGAIADLGLARKDFFPSVSVSGNLQRQMQESVFSLQADATMWLTLGGVEGTLTYTIWDFGARIANSTSAVQALYAMSYAYNQELQTTIQTVTNDYYSLLYNKAAYLDRERDVSDAKVLLDAVEKKLQLGIANITDLVQAKTNYLSTQVDLVTQKDSTENAYATLAQNMGMAANQAFETQNFPCELPGQEFLAKSDTFIDIALQSRPELVEYKSQVLSKKAALVSSKLEPLPKLTGELDLGYEAYNGFPNAANFTGKFEVTFPFFDGFSYRNKIRQAKAELKTAKANFKLIQDKILGEVTTYYNNYKNAVEKIEYTQEYLDAAFDEFEVTLGNYKAGTGDILDVLQALTSLANARTQFTLSVQELFSSLTNLAYSTGSLITPEKNSDWEGIYKFNSENTK